MVTLWDHHVVDFTHTFEKETGEVYHHTIDHFLTMKRSLGSVADAGVLHHVRNMSDHEPIFAVINVDIEDTTKKDDVYEPPRPPKPMWKNATEDQKLDYNDVLFRKLITMDVPASVSSCHDVHCNDSNHRTEVDAFVLELLENVSHSGHETIPLVAPKKKAKVKKKTAGWKEYVEPYQDKAHFWHSVWHSAGRPVNTELHRIMKKTRNIFHYQVRKCRRVEDYIKNQKIIENCLANDTDLFTEIRKQRANPNDEDITIDGAAGKDILDKFVEIYKEQRTRLQEH